MSSWCTAGIGKGDRPAVCPWGVRRARVVRTAGRVHRTCSARTHASVRWYRCPTTLSLLDRAIGLSGRDPAWTLGQRRRPADVAAHTQLTTGSANTRQPRATMLASGNARELQTSPGAGMAKYLLNQRAVDKARALIDAKQYVLDSDWGDVQPEADAQNAYLDSHGWDDYAAWHLGLTEGANDETKARYAFVYGDFRRIHRTGLIACVYRAAEWRHKDVELAAHDLLQHLDATSG